MISEQSQSPLLRLPPELRNRIYGYALTINKDLCYAYHGTGVTPLLCDAYPDSYLSTTFGIEFNKLKYVCLQLYVETAAIELRFNTVNIRGRYHEPERRPTLVASDFLERLSLSMRSRLIHVVLKLAHSELPRGFNNVSWLIEDPSSFVRIAKFCVQNPHVRVDYVVRAFSTYDITRSCSTRNPSGRVRMFLSQGIWVSSLFLGAELHAIVPRDYVDRCYCFFENTYSVTEGGNIIEPTASNLRIRPADTELSPDFTDWLYSPGASHHDFTAEQVRLCLEAAEDWVTNGIGVRGVQPR
jgi:hypothetical protein